MYKRDVCIREMSVLEKRLYLRGVGTKNVDVKEY